MMKGIVPVYYCEKCTKCGYRRIRAVSCTTHFQPCSKCGGSMKMVKKVSKPSIGDHVWVSVMNLINDAGGIKSNGKDKNI